MNRFWLPILGTAFLAITASASDVYVSPRTGEITFTQTDQELPTPLGRLPVTRSYDTNEKAGVMGPGWRLNLLSEIRFLDPSCFAVVQAGIPVFFQKVRNLQRYDGPMGARASLDGKEWVVQSGDGSSSRYDEKGRELSRTDSNGNKINFAYDAAGRISEIAAIKGYALKFQYGTNGRLAALADSSGRSSEYQYDASRRLTQVRGANGRATVFSYDSGLKLSGILFPSGEKVQLVYDSTNRISAYSSSRDPSLKYMYGQTTHVTRQDGFWWEMAYDNRGRPVESRDSLKRVSRMSWNDKGQLTSQQFPDGSATAYFYDDSGRGIKETTGRGDILETTYDGGTNRPLIISFNGAAMHLSYDAKGNLISRTTPAGRRTSYTYDSSGRMISVSDGEGRTVRIEYDPLGNRIRQVKTDKSIVSWEYDAQGRVLRRKDSSGSIVQYQYDNHDRLIGMVLPDGTRLSTDYDSAGHVVRESQGAQTLQYSYNAQGYVDRVDYSDGSFASLSYDQLGNLAAFTDTLGLTARKQFDALGRQVAMTYPNGATAATTYDASGKVRSFSVAQNTASITTENNGRRILFHDPAGSETRIVLGKFGEVIEQVTPEGGIERRTFDPDGLLESVTLPQGDSWRFAYDNSGLLKEVAFPDGSLQKWEYNPVDRLGALVLPWGAKTSYRYDSDGLLTEMTNARGEKISYQYDRAGRMTRKLTALETWDYKYDVQGNLLQAGNGTFTIRYSYDSQSRLLEIGYPEWRKTIRYSYDKFGRVISRSEPDGRQTLYSYDSLGRFSRITNEKNEAVTLAYNQAGHLIARSLPNGTRTDYTYDRFDRITLIEHKNASGKTISSQSYAYDVAGNRVEAQDEQGRKFIYRYDNERRLIDEQGPSWEKAYVYGSGGNRSSMTDNSGSTSYRYDQAGRLIQAGEVSFTYDADGNLVSRRDKSGETRFAYDGEDRLVKAELPDGKTIAYGYGPFGERIYREENGRRINYLLDGNGILQELSQDYRTQASYFYAGLDQPLFMTFADGKRCYFHQDVLGSILAVSDGTGEVGGKYSYDAFGNILDQHEKGFHQPLRFTGRPLDEATGFYDFRARFYDSRVGRFVSRDPISGDIEDPPSFASYLYARDNPVSHMDPSGLAASPDASDLFNFFANAKIPPPYFLNPEYTLGLVTDDQLISPETVAKVDAHVGYLREHYGEKTAQGYLDRVQKYNRMCFEANPEIARSPSARAATVNIDLPVADPQKTIASPVSPQPAAAVADAAAPAEVAAGTRGQAASFKPLGPTGREMEMNSYAAAAGIGIAAINAADAFGENYDPFGTGEWREDAFDNLDRKAYGYLSSPDTIKHVGLMAGFGLAGYAAAGTPAGLAIAGIGAVAGGTGLAVVAGSRVVAAAQEGVGYDQALQREAGNASRAGIQTSNVTDNFADILASLKGKMAELDDLRPKAQAAFDEIKALDREIGNKKNEMQSKEDKLVSLSAEAGKLDQELSTNPDSTDSSANTATVMLQAKQLMGQINEARKKTCDFADQARTAIDSQEQQTVITEAAGAASDAEAKAGQVASLLQASPPGSESSAATAFTSIQQKAEEATDLVAGMSEDKTAIDERIQVCEKDQPIIERAASLQADILSHLNTLRNFNDPSGELPGIRQRAELPVPSKDESSQILDLSRQCRDEAEKMLGRAKEYLRLIQQVLENVRAKQPAASTQADPQALITEAKSLAQQARACADRCKQAASSQPGAAGSGFGDGVATTGIDPSQEQKTDQNEPSSPDADENADNQQGGAGFGDGIATAGTDPLNGQNEGQTDAGTNGADKNSTDDQKKNAGGSGSATPSTSFAAGQPAACHIYATGSRLGWADGLARYSEGPSDRSIIDHLNVAGEHARMANYESYPPTKAWPGWNQIKSQFASWGQRLVRYPNDTTRRQLANSMQDVAEPLANQLAVQTVGNTEPMPNCDAAYMRLGFRLAYGWQVLAIADEASRGSDSQLATRARQDGISYLQAANRILADYEKIKVASGRCADLKDVRKEVESLMLSNDRQAQVREAGQAWQLALDRICMLSAPVSSPPQISTAPSRPVTQNTAAPSHPVVQQPVMAAPSAQGPVNLSPYTSISIEGQLKPIEYELSYPHNPSMQAERKTDQSTHINLPDHSGQFVGNQYIAEWNQMLASPFLWTPNDLYGRIQNIPHLSKGRVTVTFDSTFHRILNLAMEVQSSSPNNPQLFQTLSLNLTNMPGDGPNGSLPPQSTRANYTIEGENLCSHITALEGQSQDIWGGSTWVFNRLVSFGCEGQYVYMRVIFTRPK